MRVTNSEQVDIWAMGQCLGKRCFSSCCHEGRQRVHALTAVTHTGEKQQQQQQQQHTKGEKQAFRRQMVL